MARSASSCCAVSEAPPGRRTLLEPRSGEVASCGTDETTKPSVGSGRKSVLKRDRQASPRSPKGKRGSAVNVECGAPAGDAARTESSKASAKYSSNASDPDAGGGVASHPGRSRVLSRMSEKLTGKYEKVGQMSPGRRKLPFTPEKEQASPSTTPSNSARVASLSPPEAALVSGSQASMASTPAAAPAPADGWPRPPVSIAEGLAAAARLAGTGSTAEPLTVVGPVASGAAADGSPGVNSSSWVRLRPLPYEPVPRDGDDNRHRTFMYKGSIVEIPFLPFGEFAGGASSQGGPPFRASWAVVKSKLESAHNAKALRMN